MAKQYRATTQLALSLMIGLGAGVAQADVFDGGTGVARSTPDAASLNPANAAFVPGTMAEMTPSIYRSNSLQVRYPGLPTIEKSDSGVSFPLTAPSYIYKVTPSIGIGGFVAPPLPFELEETISRIPVVLLGTLNYVDINVKGKLLGYADLVGGIRFGNHFGMGLSLKFLAVQGSGELVPSEGGAALGSGTATVSETSVGVGIRFDPVPGRFSIGISSGLFAASSRKIEVQSPLLDAAPTDGDEPARDPLGDVSGSSSSIGNPLNAFSAGITVGQPDVFGASLDMNYSRAAPGAKTFSLVDLAEKEVDNYSTLSVASGLWFQIKSDLKAMAGFAYNPAAIGPGSPGKDGKAGYGTLDVIGLFVPLLGGDLRPNWTIAGGAEYRFGLKRVGGPRKKRRRGKRSGPPAKMYYQWAVGSGLAYTRGSLGIDENGELPGAYLQKSMTIPIRVRFRL